jgi:membrane protease YdiL (CAAX protease family)
VTPGLAGGEGRPEDGDGPVLGEAIPWKVGHAVAAFATGLLASAAASLAVARGGISDLEIFAVVGPAQCLATIAVVAALRRSARLRREPLGLRLVPADAWGLLIGASLEVALSLAIYTVARLVFGGELPVQEVVTAADQAVGLSTRLAVVATAVVLAPLSEELVFRGVLVRALRWRWGAKVALFGSAAPFALVHLLDPNAALAVPALFVVGLVLARQVQKSGRLGRALATHVGFNLVGVLLLFFA